MPQMSKCGEEHSMEVDEKPSIGTRDFDFENYDFDSQLTEQYILLKKRRSAATCNFQIICNRRKIPVHKEVLIERCLFFKGLLGSNFIEKDSNSISLNYDVDIKILKTILDYLYTGKIRVTGNNVFDVCMTASYLMLEALTKVCRIYLRNGIDHHTVDLIESFGQTYSFPQLVSATDSYRQMHFEDFTKMESTLWWPYELLKQLVTSSKLQVSEEDRVVKFVCKWLNTDFNERKQHMNELLSEIRYSFVTSDNILDVIDEDVNLKICQNCVKQQSNCKSVDKSIKLKKRLYNKGIYILGSNIIQGPKNIGVRKLHNIWTFERYWPKDKTTVSLPAPEGMRSGHQLVNLGGNLVMVGGVVDGRNVLDSRFLDEVLMYVTAEKVWKKLRPLTHARSAHMCCVFQGRIFVFGGVNSTNNTNDNVLDNECYCPRRNKWKTYSNHPSLGCCSAAVAVGDSMYLVSSTNVKGRFWLRRFKPNIMECKFVEHDIGLDHLEHFTMVGHGTKLYIFKSNRKVVVHDVEKQTFHENYFAPSREVIPIRRRGRIFVYNDLIYIVYQTIEDFGDHDFRAAVLDPKVLELGDDVGKQIKKLFQYRISFRSTVDFVRNITGI